MTVSIVMTQDEVELHEIAVQINDTLKLAELKFKQGMEDVCHIGGLLIKAKELVKRTGNGWMDWVEENLDITIQQVNKYMRVNRREPELLENESGLSISNFSIEGAVKYLAAKDREAKQNGDLGELPPAPVWDGSYALNNIYVADTTTLEFVRSLPADSIDMMFSDPPWDEKSLPLYEAAGRLAARVLKPGGWCALYAGKMFMPEIYSILSAWLDYEWTFCVFQPDNQHIMKGLYEAWRPIVLFRKPGERRKHAMLPDAYKSPREKGYHDWQQGHLPIKKYIEAFTNKQDIVIDPYVGGGTVPWVCQQLERNFLAFDDDEEDVSLSLARLRNGRRET